MINLYDESQKLKKVYQRQVQFKIDVLSEFSYYKILLNYLPKKPWVEAKQQKQT